MYLAKRVTKISRILPTTASTPQFSNTGNIISTFSHEVYGSGFTSKITSVRGHMSDGELLGSMSKYPSVHQFIQGTSSPATTNLASLNNDGPFIASEDQEGIEKTVYHADYRISACRFRKKRTSLSKEDSASADKTAITSDAPPPSH